MYLISFFTLHSNQSRINRSRLKPRSLVEFSTRYPLFRKHVPLLVDLLVQMFLLCFALLASQRLRTGARREFLCRFWFVASRMDSGFAVPRINKRSFGLNEVSTWCQCRQIDIHYLTPRGNVISLIALLFGAFHFSVITVIFSGVDFITVSQLWKNCYSFVRLSWHIQCRVTRTRVTRFFVAQLQKLTSKVRRWKKFSWKWFTTLNKNRKISTTNLRLRGLRLFENKICYLLLSFTHVNVTHIQRWKLMQYRSIRWYLLCC